MSLKSERARLRNWTLCYLIGVDTFLNSRISDNRSESVAGKKPVYMTPDEVVILKRMRALIDTLKNDWNYNSQDMGMKVKGLPKLSTTSIKDFPIEKTKTILYVDEATGLGRQITFEFDVDNEPISSTAAESRRSYYESIRKRTEKWINNLPKKI